MSDSVFVIVYREAGGGPVAVPEGYSIEGLFKGSRDEVHSLCMSMNAKLYEDINMDELDFPFDLEEFLDIDDHYYDYEEVEPFKVPNRLK